MTRHRRLAATVAGLALLLGGCSSGGEATSASQAPYAEPGWMAEARAQEEVYQRAVDACIRAEGYEPRGGGSVITLQSRSLSDDPAAESDEAERQAQVLEKCSTAAPTPDYMAAARETTFAQVSDFVACVENEGYEMPAMPTFETWADQIQARTAWNPLYDGFGTSASVPKGWEPPLHVVTEAELARLQQVCVPGALGFILPPADVK